MGNWKRFWNTLRPGQLDSDIDAELRFHVEQRMEESIEAGMAPEQARREAQRQFGNRTLLKESTREDNVVVWLQTAFDDVRYALRGFGRSPGFAATAILSVGLGIGANTAIFSFVNALLLKRLPVPQPERLVQIAEYRDGNVMNSVFSFPFLADLDRENRVFGGILGRYPVRVSLATDGVAEALNGEVVTGSYFKTLRIEPALGRLLTEEDIGAAAGDPVCVISYSTWQERFGGDLDIVGRKLLLNAHSYVVAGVTQQGFYGMQLQLRVDLQLPVSRTGDFMGGAGAMWKSPGFSWLQPLARLKPGLSVAQAQAEMDPLARAIRAREGKSETTFRLADGSQGNYYDFGLSKPVTVLMGIVALVLLIACANLASLLLARGNARAKEFAVRLSLGASRSRVVRQLMAESLAIACCGGLVGLLLTMWIIHTLLVYLNAGLPDGVRLHVGLDPVVICFSIVLSLLTAVLFGLVPAWQCARPDMIPELKGSPRRTRAGSDCGGA
jgi:predicted permease